MKLSTFAIETITGVFNGEKCVHCYKHTYGKLSTYLPKGVVCSEECEGKTISAYSKSANSHSFKNRWIAKFNITRANNIGKAPPCDRHMNYKRCTAAIMNDDNFRSFRMQKT